MDLQVVKGRTARQRRSWAVPPCSSSTELLGWGARATHECASLLRSMVGDRTCLHATSELRRGGACQADAGPEAARIGNTVLRWDGPAPALARGASTRRSEDRCYASWRGLCRVKLSIHEPGEGEGGPLRSHFQPSAASPGITCSSSTRTSQASSCIAVPSFWARASLEPGSSPTIK